MIDFEQFKTKAEVIKYLKATKDISCQTTAQAEKYLRAHLPKESYYQDKIIKHIKELLPSAFVWKAAAGPYSRQGIPDVCAIVNGRFYGFEVKRPFIGVLSKIQERTIKQIQEAGGKAYVVTYTAEVTRILQKRDGGKMKENPANAIKDTMWTFLMDKGQASNIPALKEYVYNLIGMTTQKTAGQRKTAKNDIPWEQLDMTLMSIVIEATALVLSGDLEKLEQFGDKTGKYAGMIESFECDFSLAVERGNEYGLDDLQVKIEQGNNKLLSDIELLKELSYGLRSGSLKIIKQPEKGGDPPIEE